MAIAERAGGWAARCVGCAQRIVLDVNGMVMTRLGGRLLLTLLDL